MLKEAPTPGRSFTAYAAENIDFLRFVLTLVNRNRYSPNLLSVNSLKPPVCLSFGNRYSGCSGFFLILVFIYRVNKIVSALFLGGIC